MLAGIGVILAFAGCQEPLAPAAETPQALEPSARVARVIAEAMSDPAVRSSVLGAMRASPLSEHKLVLQEYLAGPEGELLVAGIGRAGLNQADLVTTVRELPRMQFYVPARAQRLTWRGTPDVLVGATLTATSVVQAFSPSGVPVRLDLRTDRELPGTLFLLQVAEPMFKRIVSQGQAPGSVIQDPDDRDLAGGWIYRDGSGRIVRVEDFADMRKRPRFAFECAPEVFFCDVEGGGGSYPSGTYLTRLVNHGVCDNACIFETLEFEFRTTSQFNGTLEVSTHLMGINPTHDWNGYFFISPYRPFGQWVEIGVWETDSWPNEDDPFLCQEFGGGWGACQANWLPRAQVAQVGGTASFSFCENLPWECFWSPSDLEASFKDQP
jgi:hypothetical protein